MVRREKENMGINRGEKKRENRMSENKMRERMCVREK